MSFWTSSLSQIWRIKTLPDICCETKLDENGVQGRVQVRHGSQPPTPWIPLNQPLKLRVHREEKPWGCEVWFTGIEERGVCSVEYAPGQTLALPSYLELVAGPRTADETQPTDIPLLKILEPHHATQLGCLYIEVHEQKWETYFVSNLDAQAWPNGIGQVLFGFSAQKISEFQGDEKSFKRALLCDVKAYEAVRNEIDVLSVTEVDSPLHQKEAKLWQTVRSYFEFINVRVGDIIRVPPFVPHSLQNGVQVVEFQTPTYERLILAFNQKVLTQNHWDTERALEVAIFKSGTQLHAELSDLRKNSASAPQWSVSVDFPGFQVLSVELEDSEQFVEIPEGVKSHSVVFVLTGAIEFKRINGASVLTVASGEAALIPIQKQKEALSLTALQPHSKLLFV